MEKTIGYILGQLRDTEIAVKTVTKVLRRQARFNRNAAIINLSISLYIMINEARWSCQKQINKELRKELDALKQTKGE